MPDEPSAIKMSENLGAVSAGVLYYPAREFTFQQVAGLSHEFEHLRLGVLSAVLNDEFTAVVCSVNAAVQMTMPPAELQKRTAVISVGEMVNVDDIVNKLVYAGYSRYDQVDGTSQFAVRGGIIDIFPPGFDEPVRIELWGDTVDTISHFDIATQRRTRNAKRIEIIPATEVLFDSKEKFAASIENLAKSLKGKAVKAREKLYEDAENLKNGLSIVCSDKYLPLAYESSGIFDYLGDNLLFICESARVKRKQIISLN